MQTMMSSVLGKGQNVGDSNEDVPQFSRFLRKTYQVFLSVVTPRERQELNQIKSELFIR